MITTEKIDKICLSHKGTRKDFKEEWDATRYLIDDKMFIMLGTEKSGRPILTLKLKPEHGELLRASYPLKVMAGYYMNKVHWNSFFLDTEIDEKLLEDCIKESYELVLGSLTQKRQKEIMA